MPISHRWLGADGTLKIQEDFTAVNETIRKDLDAELSDLERALLRARTHALYRHNWITKAGQDVLRFPDIKATERFNPAETLWDNGQGWTWKAVEAASSAVAENEPAVLEMWEVSLILSVSNDVH